MFDHTHRDLGEQGFLEPIINYGISPGLSICDQTSVNRRLQFYWRKSTSLVATRKKDKGLYLPTDRSPLVCSVRIYWNETFENHPKQNIRNPESSSSVCLLLFTMRCGISYFICWDWDEAMRKSDKKIRVCCAVEKEILGNSKLLWIKIKTDK